MSTPVSQIRIYEHGQRASGDPLDYCTREAAQRLVDRRLARWRMSGFAIQFREPPAKRQRHKKFIKIVIHGTSCQMGPHVTEDATDDSAPGHKLAKAAALAYLLGLAAPDNMAGSYCPLIPMTR